MNYKNILAIGAHPDDIEFGCLGFLKFNSNTAKIHVYVASAGSIEDHSSGKKRVKETKQALAVLNCSSLFVRNKKGIGQDDFQEILADIEGILEQAEPELILTHGPNDTHQEHRLLYDIVVSAARRRKLSILRYSIVSNNATFLPNFFFELSEPMVKMKMQQLACHDSQNDKFYMSKEYIERFHSRPLTQLHEMKYCEAFEVERIML